MRLSVEQIAIIRRSTEEVFGADAKVWLFGSRVDDSKRGGDIDLLVAIPAAVADDVWKVAELAAKLERRFDGRKVDVILDAPNLRPQAIHQIAREQGVLL